MCQPLPTSQIRATTRALSVSVDMPDEHVLGGRTSSELLPHGVFGMLIFVVTEIMLFAGLISAFVVGKAATPIWPPPGQPRLPVEATAFNSAALILSGVFMLLAYWAFHRGDREKTRYAVWLSFLLGAVFVVLQGREWIALLSQGLTLNSSNLGGFFYLIVGIHGLHAFAALCLLGFVAFRLHRGRLTPGLMGAVEIFWLFVVGIWPILYTVVYL